MARLERVAIAVGQRYKAHFTLHAVACMQGNTDEMVQRRDELHTVLDAMLDNGEAIQHLTTELQNITND